MKNFGKKIVIEVDSREKYPLPFPATLVWRPALGYEPVRMKLCTTIVKMTSGDYRLKNWPDLAVVERKASLMELWGNLLTRDRNRALGALDRLIGACKFPYLMIEGNPPEMYRKLKGFKFGDGRSVEEPGVVVDALCSVLEQRPTLKLVWMGSQASQDSRRCLGDLVSRMLLSHAARHEIEKWKQEHPAPSATGRSASSQQSLKQERPSSEPPKGEPTPEGPTTP